MNVKQTVVDLIRHGEPVGGHRIRGQSDDPLTELGWSQMRAAVADYASWQHIITSPLQRCSAFAHELAARHALPLSVEARFKEIGFGEWEGCAHEELKRREPERYAGFRNQPLTDMPPGAEPVEGFVARIAAAWRELLVAHAGQQVLVVCHAGVIRAVITTVLGAPAAHLFRSEVRYAGLTRVCVAGDGEPQLVFHGGSLP